jgi:hypothetical protein
LRSVLIAVPTTGTRPLAALLEELLEQARAAQHKGRAVSVLLLDNAQDTSGRVRAVAAASAVRYQRVGRQGFAQVRNAALDAAEQHDAVVFIDDDEYPSPGWLEALLQSADEHRADVVVGPVPVRLPPGAPGWADGGATLRPPRTQPDGPLRGPANSGNTLVRMSAVERLQVRFDSAFDHTGGEDTVFFGHLTRHGARLVWASAAVAVESPDRDRLTLSCVLRRSYRSGRATALVERRLGAGSPAVLGLRRAGRAARGLVRLLRAALRRCAPEGARALMDLAFCGGWLLATLSLTLRRGVRGC